MANGNVAPLVQGDSYSDMVAKQVALINRQRETNLAQRLAQDEKNREFKTEQLQNIYDFDVSGLAAGDAAIFAELQKTLSNSLDPDSTDSYSSSQELIADISYANNLYNNMKHWGAVGRQGQQAYQGYMLEGMGSEDYIFDGNEDSYNELNQYWDTGGFQWDGQIGGTAGNRTITGKSVGRDGTVGQDVINFSDNVIRSRPEEWYRPEIREARMFSGFDWYVDKAPKNLNAGEARQWMEMEWEKDEGIRRRAARAVIREERLQTTVDEYLSNEMNVTNLRGAVINEAVRAQRMTAEEVKAVGVFGNQTVETSPILDDDNNVLIGRGIGYQINPERPLELVGGGLQGVDVLAVALNWDGSFTVTHAGDEEALETNIPAGVQNQNHRNVLEHIKKEGLIALENARALTSKPSVDKSSDDDAVKGYTFNERTDEKERLIELFAETFKEETGKDIADYINTDEEPLDNKLNVVTSLNNLEDTESLYELFIKEYREKERKEGYTLKLPTTKSGGYEKGGIIPRIRKFFGQ